MMDNTGMLQKLAFLALIAKFLYLAALSFPSKDRFTVPNHAAWEKMFMPRTLLILLSSLLDPETPGEVFVWGKVVVQQISAGNLSSCPQQ